MGFFSKNKKKPLSNTGYFIMVDYTEQAKRWIVGGNKNKRIYHLNNGVQIHEETYNPIKILHYQREGFKIIDRTRGTPIPKDAINVTPEQQALGQLEIHKRVE